MLRRLLLLLQLLRRLPVLLLPTRGFAEKRFRPTEVLLNTMTCPATTAEQAWHAFSEGLRAFIRSRLANHADADDLLQDVFVRVHEKIDSLQQSERVESWVYQIARNALADFYRRHSPRSVNSIEALVDPLADAESNQNFNQTVAAWLLVMIEELPPTLREAVRMYEVEGVGQAEIAERLDISLSAAKSRVQRGRRQLESIIRKSCELDLDSRGNVIACKPVKENECGQTSCGCD